MFMHKHAGLTLLLGSLLAACTSAPKKPVEPNLATAVSSTNAAENTEPDLEKLAKERAAQGGGVKKEDIKETTKAATDTSQEPELPPVSEEQKKLAAPVLADYQKALELMKARQFDQAYALFDEIQSKTPMLLGPVLNQALIRIQQKNFKEAELILQKAGGINEKNPYIYNLQGYILRQQGKFADARSAYEKALAISPKYAKAHFNLGVLADLYLQDLPLALQHYEAYQGLQGTPDVTVGKWIVDLQKRTGVYKAPAKPVKTEEVTVEETPAAAADANTAAVPPANGDNQTAPAATTAPAADTTAPEPAATPAPTTPAAQPAVETPPTPVDDHQKTKTKGKKAAKSKKTPQNVSVDTAPAPAEAVKSTPSEPVPPASTGSEPTPTTTAAGVQP